MVLERNLSNYFRPVSAVHVSTLFWLLVGLLVMAAPSSAQVSVSPDTQIWNAPPYTRTFTVTVPSDISLGSVAALTLGAPNLDFTVVSSGTTCPIVTAGECTVEVQFQPRAAGRRSGALVINDPSGNTLANVSLFGMSILPLAGFAPGVISTIAGNGTAGSSGDTGQAASAQLAGPTSTSLDGFGNIYIADPNNNKIRKVTPAGIISTFAGNGTAGYSGDNGPATSAQLNRPMAVLVDGSGWVYVADTGNHVIRVVNSAGVISTYAGQYYTGSNRPAVCTAETAAFQPNPYADSVGDGCYANQIVLDTPVDLAMCHAGNLHILDQAQNRERTVFRTSLATITQVGNGTAGYNGDGELSTAAALNAPTAIDLDASNYIYIADTGNHIIRKALLTGTIPNPISTVAGIPGTAGYLGDGEVATSAQLNGPHGLRVDGAGNIYINDYNNNVIRMVNAATGKISTIAGKAGSRGYSGDNGPPSNAQINDAYGLAMDKDANLYIADSGNNAIRKIDVSGVPLMLSFTGQTSATQDLTLMNLGSGATPSIPASQAPLVIDQIFTSANFSIAGSDTSCSNGQNLAAGASCVLRIEFTPTAPGPVSGQVTAVDNSASGNTQTIALSGNAQAMTNPSSSPRASGCSAAGDLAPFTLVLVAVWLSIPKRARARTSRCS